MVFCDKSLTAAIVSAAFAPINTEPSPLSPVPELLRDSDSPGPASIISSSTIVGALIAPPSVSDWPASKPERPGRRVVCGTDLDDRRSVDGELIAAIRKGRNTGKSDTPRFGIDSVGAERDRAVNQELAAVYAAADIERVASNRANRRHVLRHGGAAVTVYVLLAVV